MRGLRLAWLAENRRKRTRKERINRIDVLRALPVIGAFLLAGCSLAPFISKNSIDYNNTVENVTNNVLVTNILRARDGAPLYFSDLSQIRGNMQFNVQGQTTIPYGELYRATTRATGQAGPIAINSQPGFDFAPLNTKKFAEGMLEGIDVNVFAYFIQRGVKPKVFLNLVVSRIEHYARLPSGGFRLIETCKGDCVPWQIGEWTKYRTRSPSIGRVSSSSVVGPAIPEDRLLGQRNVIGDLIQADTAKLKLIHFKNNFQLSKTSVDYVLCVPLQKGGYEAVGIASPGARKAPTQPPIPKSNGTCSSGYSTGRGSPHGYVIYLRSVEAIFYYLGGILEKPERSPIAFYVYDRPVENARFAVDYRGVIYYVRGYSDDDQTITILAILNDLLNLNRDAGEIPSTKTVATTP